MSTCDHHRLVFSSMCRWGCPNLNSSFKCKWCGTRYCQECLRGDFVGLMVNSTTCRKCSQGKCQGTRVENVALPEIQLDKSSRVSGKRKKTKDQVVKKNKKKKRKTKKNTKK